MKNSIVKEIFIIIYVALGIFRAALFESAFVDLFLQYTQLGILCLLFFLCILDIIFGYTKINLSCVLIFLFGLVNLVVSKHTFFLGLSVFIFAFSHLDFEKILKKLNVTIIVVSLIIVLLSLIGVIENHITYRSNGDMRYQLGFATSTLPNSIILFTFLSYIFIYKRKTPLLLIIIYLLASFIMNMITGTRTGFILVLLTSVCLLLLKNKVIFSFIEKIFSYKISRILIYISPFLIFCLSVFLVYYYSLFTPLSFKLNQLFSTRLSNTLYLYQNYGISIFGQDIPTTLENGRYIGSDICYIYYLLNYGIISVIITFYLQYKLIKKSFKTSDYFLLLCVMIILIDGFVEPYLLDYKYHFFTFILSSELAYSHARQNKQVSISLRNEGLEYER